MGKPRIGKAPTLFRLKANRTMIVMKTRRSLRSLHWKLSSPIVLVKLRRVSGVWVFNCPCFDMIYFSIMVYCRSKSGNGRNSMAYVVSASDEKNENSNGGSDKSDDKSNSSKETVEGEKTSTSSNGGRVTRSSQRAAASAAHSTPTSGQNSATQSPTSSPTQNTTTQTPSPGMIWLYFPPCLLQEHNYITWTIDPGDASNCESSQPAPGNNSGVKIEEGKASEEQAVEVHPRKRKLRPREAESTSASSQETSATAVNASNSTTSSNNASAQQQQTTPTTQENATSGSAAPGTNPTPSLPVTNCYEMYFSIRKQIERRHRNLLPVQPKPPQGFKDYLMNRCTYVIAGNAASRLSVPVVSPPPSLAPPMRDLFADQEKERYRLRMQVLFSAFRGVWLSEWHRLSLQHLIEKEKLVLSVEQEILRVHGRAARALANQALPFSVCTLLKDQEVYSALTPEQEEKDRNARSRYNGRLFLSWLQDVDDKWEKIKVQLLGTTHLFHLTSSTLLSIYTHLKGVYAAASPQWGWIPACCPENGLGMEDQGNGTLRTSKQIGRRCRWAPCSNGQRIRRFRFQLQR